MHYLQKSMGCEIAQITQNKKFAIFLQYLKNEVNDEVDFLHIDNNENLLQIDTTILMGITMIFNTLDTKVSYKMMLSLLMSMIEHS